MRRADLDKAAIGMGRKKIFHGRLPDEGNLFFHGPCHPYSPTWAVYETRTGYIIISCAECRTVIARVEVAE
jgi:hypothetical protein